MECEIDRCLNEVNADYNNAKSVDMFFSSTCQKLSQSFAEHYVAMSEINWPSHGFAFGEEQAKLFMSSALLNVCSGRAIMEQPIQRRRSKGTEEGDPKIGNGRMDYWLSYGSSTILLEMKHGLIRINPDTEMVSGFGGVEKKNNDAVAQMRNIDQKLFWKSRDSLWGTSFIVAPVAIGVDDDDDTQSYLNLYERSKNHIVDKLGKHKFNKVNVWKLDDKLSKPVRWVDFDGNAWREAYPAVFYCATFHKLSRETR